GLGFGATAPSAPAPSDADSAAPEAITGEWLVIPSRPISEAEVEPEAVGRRLRSARLAPKRSSVLAAAVVGIAILVLLGAAVGLKLLRHDAAQSTPAPAPVAASQPMPERQVIAAVGGKVHRPGLVKLSMGARVDDAVRAAGGPLDGVDLGGLNVARKVVDGELIMVGDAVPPQQPPSGAAASATPSPSGTLLDLNTAALPQLDALPGVGPIMAQRILDYRTQHGRFGSVDDLRKIDGIGETRYARLKPLVTV
ncbi:MAG: helix-hairpin-helix domain-containing protein, partial [Mycobacteriales bacterium]